MMRHRRNLRPSRGMPAGRKGSASPPAFAFGARGAAYRVLHDYKTSGRFVSQLLDDLARQAPEFQSQRPLALELVSGVVRRRATLDALLAPHVRRPRHRIEGELWTILQLGAYQLAFLDSVPAYAAINETVGLAKGV